MSKLEVGSRVQIKNEAFYGSGHPHRHRGAVGVVESVMGRRNISYLIAISETRSVIADAVDVKGI